MVRQNSKNALFIVIEFVNVDLLSAILKQEDRAQVVVGIRVIVVIISSIVRWPHEFLIRIRFVVPIELRDDSSHRDRIVNGVDKIIAVPMLEEMTREVLIVSCFFL